MQKLRKILAVAKREIFRLTSRPLYLFSMILAPLFSYIFFTTLMADGLPNDLPIGVVDEDNTSVTRQIIRNLDAFQQSKIVEQYSSFAEARKAMQQGKIYAVYYIPQGTTQLALASKQPTISFYTSATFLIPASLEYRDMKMMSEYAAGAITRSTLYAKGYTESQAMAMLQPVKMEMHAINNPSLNYSIYLSNCLLPAILSLLIMQVTIFSIYSELKEETSKEWLAMTDNDVYAAIFGKLFPQFIVWLLMGFAYLVLLYGYFHFPLHSGLLPMVILMVTLVIVSQAFAVFLCGAVPSLRWALSLATLWGVLSIPISGFSFPKMAFPPALQGASYLFPMRYYFLVYVDQALNGRPFGYTWIYYALLCAFLLLPIVVMRRLKKFLLEYHYQI
ncbi:MAG: ABC transporter permease [Bacteroidales bacterium]|nr:ABC transporter permease [Bacteroidales bacterium]